MQLSFPLSLLIGAVAGLNSACWGAYKDCPYESFYFTRYMRSILAASVIGGLSFNLFQSLSLENFNLGFFFLFVVAFERAYTEVGKMVSIKENPRLYKIPQRFHIEKTMIRDRFKSFCFGTLGIILLLSSFYFLSILSPDLSGYHPYIGVFIGLFAGLIVGIGGKIKDVPYEKFNRLKFLRSPMVGMILGGVLGFLTTDYGLLLISTIGIERMIVELYKTIVKKKKPGKFKRNKTYNKWIKLRQRLIMPYILSWFVFLFFLVKG